MSLFNFGKKVFCPTCEGQGRYEQVVNVFGGRPVTKMLDCPRCQGAGKISVKPLYERRWLKWRLVVWLFALLVLVCLWVLLASPQSILRSEKIPRIESSRLKLPTMHWMRTSHLSEAGRRNVELVSRGVRRRQELNDGYVEVKSYGGWQVALASRYLDTIMANGQKMDKSTWCVAHKHLPLETRVLISYNGKTISAPVLDRGPYVPPREFDLSYAVAEFLGFEGVHEIRWRVVR